MFVSMLHYQQEVIKNQTHYSTLRYSLASADCLFTIQQYVFLQR